MTPLEQIVRAIIEALIGWLDKRLSNQPPNTIKNEQTPSDIKKAWNDYITTKLTDRMRQNSSIDNGQK